MPERGITYQEAIEELEKRESALRRKDKRHLLVSYHSFESDEFIGEEMIVDPGPSVEELVEEKEERRRLLTAMWTGLTLLPEKEYYAIKIIFLDGLGEHGASRESGIPQKTLHYRASVALNKLRCFTEKL